MFDFWLGLRPRPSRWSSHRSPRHSSCISRVLLLTQGRRGEGEKGDARDEKKQGGKEKKGGKGGKAQKGAKSQAPSKIFGYGLA